MDYQTLTPVRQEEIKTEMLKEVEESHFRDSLTLSSINTQLGAIKGTKTEISDRLSMLKAELEKKVEKEASEIVSLKIASTSETLK